MFDLILTSPLQFSLYLSLFIFVSYGLMAGFWLVVSRWVGTPDQKIQPHASPSSEMIAVLGHALKTWLIFSLLSGWMIYAIAQGWTQVYFGIGSIGYLVFSFGLMVVLHETYFYWTHRLMHTPRFFSWHEVHHRSHNPTPLSAFSFSFREAAIHQIFLLLFVFLIPSHPLVLFGWYFLMMIFNVYGHGEYHFFHSKVLNTSHKHNLHHQSGKAHFSLYTSFWDRWMGTDK